MAPINSQTKLSEQVDFSIDVGYNDIIGQNGLGKFSQSVQFNLKQEIKDKQLPYFEIELPFKAEVPWNYGYILDSSQDLSPLKDKLNSFVKSFYDILDQRNSSKYRELMKNKIKRQSDVKYLTEKEIKAITQELDLSRIKELYPLNKYDVKLYAHGKLVRFTNKTVDEDGNRYLFKFTVPPLMPGGRDGESALNYFFYLPNGKTELEVF